MAFTRPLAATLLSITLMISSFIILCNAYGGMVGARSQVKDVKTNQEVQKLGKFSVQEYNQRNYNKGNNGDQLMFLTVVEAQKQVVSGIKYYMKIAATRRSGDIRMFDSIVVVKPWIKSKQLVHFGLSSGQAASM